MEETGQPLFFGEWLKFRRKQLDLTQAELARRAGCSVPALRKIEAGERRPSKQLAGLLAKSLEIPSEDQIIFIKVARGEQAIERLRSYGPVLVQDHLTELSPAHRRVNLPVQPTPLIGREAELAALGKLLADPQCRLLTLTGLGGIGKTRLAIEAASNHQMLFPDGVSFTPLSALTSTKFIVPAIIEALGLTLAGPQDPKKQLLNALQDKHLLLVLDNAEHLLGEAGLFREMLENASHLKLLVTSTERLNLHGEWVFEIQGLPVPPNDEVENADQFSSVALFLQRARQVQSDFSLGTQDKPWVIHICRTVEGMPLGIELAASWTSMLTCQEISQEIDNSLDFLSASMRDLPKRHRSMRMVFDYSWQMLTTQEQQALCMLSVFRGGFQRQAAEQVAGASLSILSTLVNRSLLRRTASGRYDLHEVVRIYSAAHLETDPDLYAATRERHYTFYLALARAAGQELEGRNQSEWLGKLEQDYDNLRAALDWALNEDDELALQLSGALRWFWRMRGHFHEGRNWLMESLRRHPERRTTSRALALLGLSLLTNALGDVDAARPPAEESVAIYRELGDQQGLAEALAILGLTLVWQGEARLSQASLEEALVIYRNTGNSWGVAHVLYRLGNYLADYSGDPAGQAMLEECAAILEGLGEKYIFTGVLISLGIVDMSLGYYAAARKHLERSLDIAREIRHPWGMADALINLGCVCRIQGEYMAAESYFEEAQRVYQEHASSIWEVDVLCAMAENAISQGKFAKAHLHLQVASRQLELSGNKWLHALVWYFRGLLAYYEGETEKASELLEETTTMAREGQYKPDLGRSLVTLGRVRLSSRKIAPAIKLLWEGMDLFREIGHRLGVANAIEQLAIVSATLDDNVRAASLLGWVYTLREVMGAPLPPVERSVYESTLADLRLQMGEDSFAAAWAEGRGMTLEQAVGYAKSIPLNLVME